MFFHNNEFCPHSLYMIADILFVSFMRVCQGIVAGSGGECSARATHGENGKTHFLPKLVVQRGWFIIMA